MQKQSILEKKFKAITYGSPKSVNAEEFDYELKEGITYPKIQTSLQKVYLPKDNDLLNNFVLLKVEGCGICGTDIHMYHGKRFHNDKADERNLLIPGHEIFGNVIFAGKDYEHLEGEAVVVDPIIDCYGEDKCHFCRINKNYMHTPFCEMGICGGVPGGFAEYTVGLAKNCFMVNNLTSRHKALIEPLASIIYALKYNLSMNSIPARFLILGSGTAGLLALQYIKTINRANFVFLIDKNNYKLHISKTFGADGIMCTNDVTKDELIADLLDVSDNEGFNFILELSGSGGLLSLVPNVVSKLGKVLLYGLGHKNVCFKNIDMIIEKEANIYTSLGTSNKESFKEAIKKIEKFKVDEIITHEYEGLKTFENAVKEDFFKDEYVKGVLLI